MKKKLLIIGAVIVLVFLLLEGIFGITILL